MGKFARIGQLMFQSPTYGEVNLSEIHTLIQRFIQSDPEKQYELVIGTDSQPNEIQVEFVTAIVMHRKGSGGIYFYTRQTRRKKYVLRERMYEEASLSLIAANELLTELKSDGVGKYDVEIHVDIGQIGKTKDMITEIVGMIRGSGYEVKTKPDSYAASKVADKYT